MRERVDAELESDARRTLQPRVLVSVLAYNSPVTTIATLLSLSRQTHQNYHLLLVDNASDETALQLVASELPALDIRRLPENTGYTGAANFALDIARREGYECLLIATHDVEVDPRALEYLVETAARQADAGVVGGVEFNPRTGLARASGGGVYSLWFSRLAWRSAPQAENVEESRDVFCVHGALLLFTQRAISSGVRMDEQLFMYFDEADVGFQLKQKGLREIVDRRVIFKHTRGAEEFTPLIGRMMQRNRLRVVRRHGRWYHFLFYLFYSTLLELPVKVFVRSLQGRGRFAMACIAGHLEGLRRS